MLYKEIVAGYYDDRKKFSKQNAELHVKAGDVYIYFCALNGELILR
jgi:hypothetical protein